MERDLEHSVIWEVMYLSRDKDEAGRDSIDSEGSGGKEIEMGE